MAYDPYQNGPARYPYPAQSYTQEMDSHFKLMAFEEKVKSIYILGVISMITCMGMGLIFQIITLSKIKKLVVPDAASFQSPFEQNQYETSMKKLKTAKTLAVIGIVIQIILLTVLAVLIAILIARKM